MPIELIILLLALVPVVLRTWIGWRLGATFEMRHLLAALFAMLVALRYWHPASMAASSVIALDARSLAAVVFLFLFIVAWVLAALVVNLRGEVVQSVAPNPLDHVLGGASGLISGALLGGSLLLVLTVATSGALDTQFPVQVFRIVEEHVAGVSPANPAHTLFPLFQNTNPGSPAELVWR